MSTTPDSTPAETEREAAERLAHSKSPRVYGDYGSGWRDGVLAQFDAARFPRPATEKTDDCGGCLDEECEIPETCAYHDTGLATVSELDTSRRSKSVETVLREHLGDYIQWDVNDIGAEEEFLSCDVALLVSTLAEHLTAQLPPTTAARISEMYKEKTHHPECNKSGFNLDTGRYCCDEYARWFTWGVGNE